MDISIYPHFPSHLCLLPLRSEDPDFLMTRTLFIVDEKTKEGQVEFANHGILVTATIEDGKLHVVATWSPHEFSDWCAKLIDCKVDIPKK